MKKIIANKELSRLIINKLIDEPVRPFVAVVDNATVRKFRTDVETPKLTDRIMLNFDDPLSVIQITDSVWIVARI